jgi:outer membrane protein assembly factor BamA
LDFAYISLLKPITIIISFPFSIPNNNKMKPLSLVITVLLCCNITLLAQQSDSTIVQEEFPDSQEQSFWKKHNVKFAGMPMINYDPSIKWNFAALANVFFKVSPKDTVSPLSMAGAMVGYTTNKTWYWALYTRMYLDNDNYRISIGYGDASVNFQYYEELAGMFIDFNSVYDALYIEAQRRVYKRWYLGAKFVKLETKTLYDLQGELPEPVISNMNNLGFVIARDTRDFIYNPHGGSMLNLKTGYYRDAWGSDYKFDNYEFDFTKFWGVAEDKVMVGRLSAFIASGDVPFEGQHVVKRDDMRGYTNGKHRANQVYTIQTEYRWNFYKRWGMVAFGGIATAVDNPSDLTFSGLLPSIGTGIRFMAVPSEKINVGIDVAVGKEDWGLYFRIGEAFGDK